jgi:hypothetical protein
MFTPARLCRSLFTILLHGLVLSVAAVIFLICSFLVFAP